MNVPYSERGRAAGVQAAPSSPAPTLCPLGPSASYSGTGAGIRTLV